MLRRRSLDTFYWKFYKIYYDISLQNNTIRINYNLCYIVISTQANRGYY